MDTSRRTVYVVDDDDHARTGLSRFLQSAGWYVEPFACGREFLMSDHDGGIGCILLDMIMPDMTGLELHDHLRVSGCVLPVIYVSGNSTMSLCVQAMRRGAHDFLEKPVEEAVLIAALESAMARSEYECIREHHLNTIRGRLALLSRREREVMELVIQGKMNKQIAGDLGVGVKTVKVHRGRMMSKMGVRSVADLVHLCNALSTD